MSQVKVDQLSHPRGALVVAQGDLSRSRHVLAIIRKCSCLQGGLVSAIIGRAGGSCESSMCNYTQLHFLRRLKAAILPLQYLLIGREDVCSATVNSTPSLTSAHQ